MADDAAPEPTSPSPYFGQMNNGVLNLGELQPGQYYTDPQGQSQQALMASQRPPMSMPDAIANYLTYTGGAWPSAGIPGVPQPLIGPGAGGFQRGANGYFTANPAEPAPTEAASDVPANLQGYQRLPSGQFMPNEPQTAAAEEPLAPTAAGQLIGGMSPEAWLKKYRGEA